MQCVWIAKQNYRCRALPWGTFPGSDCKTTCRVHANFGLIWRMLVKGFCRKHHCAKMQHFPNHGLPWEHGNILSLRLFVGISCMKQNSPEMRPGFRERVILEGMEGLTLNKDKGITAFLRVNGNQRSFNRGLAFIVCMSSWRVDLLAGSSCPRTRVQRFLDIIPSEDSSSKPSFRGFLQHALGVDGC